MADKLYCDYVATGTSNPPPAGLPLILEFIDITVITGYSGLSVWNSAFPGATPFTFLLIAGNTVSLWGGAGKIVPGNCFASQGLLTVDDQALCLTTVSANAFVNSTTLTLFRANAVATVGDYAFDFSSGVGLTLEFLAVTTIGTFSFSNNTITSINMPLLTSMGVAAFLSSNIVTASFAILTTFPTRPPIQEE